MFGVPGPGFLAYLDQIFGVPGPGGFSGGIEEVFGRYLGGVLYSFRRFLEGT